MKVENLKMDEIEVSKILSQIEDSSSKENIVNSGRVQGINIYQDKLNILIIKKQTDDNKDFDNIKSLIREKLSLFTKIKIDIKEGLEKSDITHLLNMSKFSKKIKN